MSCVLQLVVDPISPTSCLPAELFDYLSTGLQILTADCGECVCYVRQTTPPGPEQLDFVWMEISNIGVPLQDNVFYNGEWRRKPSFPIGAEVWFSGDPALYFDPVTNLGLHADQWDGWEIDVTQFGHFPVIASGYSTAGLGWIINYQAIDLNVGGTGSITLDNDNTYRPATNGLTTTLHARGNPGVGNFVLWGDFAAGLGQETIIPADPGNLNPPAIPTFPTFVAKALVVYRGVENT